MGIGRSMSDWLARSTYHLQGWAEYRRVCRGSIVKGYPVRSAFLSTGGNSAEFDELVNEADFATARICDSVIGGLSDIFKTALEARYLMQGSMKNNRRPEAELLLEAQFEFWQQAKKFLI